ncbi:P-loop NTPase fold protein, partial [Mycetocola sp.]|uniref:KAP family P-loop NTPase fold protein n=1 Tax=Mycetocola sp. TaxID=1871042 RepID=UPI0039891E01
MWPDNETDLDLLGFEYLVDELIVALSEPALLPLTVGVLGEWGSGKSSLINIVQAELDSSVEPKFLTVGFSPWQYEDYDDVKLSLMQSVLDACSSVTNDPARINALRRFVRVVGAFGRKATQVGLRAAPAAAAGVASALDPSVFDPASAQLIGKVVGSTAEAIADDLDKSEETVEQAVTSLAGFRAKFKEMVDELPVQAVVIFIDDLDRCLPTTVVDTFEAIRLFLNSPKTAFVIAAHRQIAESAIDAAFPDYGRLGGASLGHDYLEKMLQLQITVPKLSVEDASAYISL